MIGKGWLLEIALRYGIPFYHPVDRAIIPINSLLHIQLQLFDDAVCQPISLPASVTFLNDEPYIPEDLTIPPWKILVMDARKEEKVLKSAPVGNDFSSQHQIFIACMVGQARKIRPLSRTVTELDKR